MLEKPQGEPNSENQRSSSGSVEPYLDAIKARLGPAPGASELHYSDQIRADHPEWKSDELPDSYSALEQQKLAPHEEGGAIQSVLDGHSELHPKKYGEAHHAFGFRYGAALTRNLTAPPGIQLRNFNDVYGSSYAPDLSLFFEFQPFKRSGLASFGILLMGGIAAYEGYGQLSIPIANPNGGNFPSLSSIKFQFFTAPVVVAADCRVSLLKYVQFFGVLGPTVVGYLETRNDGIQGNRGYSAGLYGSAGVSFQLDWIYPSGAWDLYQTFGIQHDYLTVEFSEMTTFAGEVNVNIYGVTAGITFEY
jgi:hypothetical protein